MRGIKPRLASVAAVSAGESLAAATRYRGVGALAEADIKASARACNIWVSEVWASELVLTRGTPPSWDTRSAHPACCKSGRWALE
jgi:hypothetical protein